MSRVITLAPLAEHRDRLPLLQRWFETEWPSWYGPGGRGDARGDLEAFASDGDGLPAGVIALDDGEPCGVAALKAESIASLRDLRPWAAAGLVPPTLRGRGIGAQLLGALEARALELGFDRIYCGTSTAGSLLLRCGWRLVESIEHEGEPLGIYDKPLAMTRR